MQPIDRLLGRQVLVKRTFSDPYKAVFLITLAPTIVHLLGDIVIKRTALFAFLLIFHPLASASPEPWTSVSEEHGIGSWTLLYAVALAEAKLASPDKRSWRPWPWTVRSAAEGPKRFETEAQALAHIEDLLSRGATNIDVGFMQLNWKWQSHRFGGDVARMLDPIENMRAGAQVLREALESTHDPVLGVGRYHIWKDEDRARWYGRLVLDLDRQVRDHFQVGKTQSTFIDWEHHAR